MKRILLINAFTLMVGVSFSEEISAFQVKNFSSSFDAGVGLIIKIIDGHFIVRGFVQGCPAQKDKFIEIGDEIVKIKANAESQWVSLKGLTLERVQALIHGEAGKPLFLERWRGQDKYVVILRREENCQ